MNTVIQPLPVPLQIMRILPLQGESPTARVFFLILELGFKMCVKTKGNVFTTDCVLVSGIYPLYLSS